MGDRSVVSLCGVCFSRPTSKTQILENITLEVFDGESVAILGPNGCGKTTLLHLILGRLKPTAGTLIVSPVTTGYVDQELVLFPWLTIRGNILFGPRRRGVSNEHQAAMLAGLRERLRVDDLLDKYPFRLSGGMRQRAVLARALAESPQLMLLDEPFSALDISLKADLYLLFGKMQNTLLLVTHDPAEAVRLSNRIVILGVNDAGASRIIAELASDRTSSSYRSQVESALRILLAHTQDECLSLEVVLKRESCVPSGDRVLVIAWGLDRTAYDSSSLATVCTNLTRGVKYRYLLPLTPPSSLEEFAGAVRRRTGISLESLKALLEFKIVAHSAVHVPSHEYVILEHDGSPEMGWQFPLPLDYRYVFALKENAMHSLWHNANAAASLQPSRVSG
jgi:NitT/TauT family transport system ATP-binding protein